MPELTNAEQIVEKINSLQSLLLEKHPRIPGLLREIHNALKEDPDVVTLLPEESITKLVRGLEYQTQSELISVVTKSKSVKKNVSVDDL